MNILVTQYTLSLRSLDIYLAGCNGNPHCQNCHNPESWNFNQGKKFTTDYFTKRIKHKVEEFNELIDNVMIFGGEPLDQDLNALITFLKYLATLNKKIWLFTRYDYSEVPDDVYSLCHYIKVGRYEPSLKIDNYKMFGITLATSNQKIHQTSLGGKFKCKEVLN